MKLLSAVGSSQRRARRSDNESLSASEPTSALQAPPAPALGAPGPRRQAHRAAPAGLDATRLNHLVGYATSRASIKLRKVFAAHMDALDLKVVEFSILMLVAHNARVNQKQLGHELDISPPNMAVTLDRMVERGWVERVRSTEDRRAQHIHLTAAGRELVARAEAIYMTMEDDALRLLSGAERALLIELLLKVAGGKGAKR